MPCDDMYCEYVTICYGMPMSITWSHKRYCRLTVRQEMGFELMPRGNSSANTCLSFHGSKYLITSTLIESFQIYLCKYASACIRECAWCSYQRCCHFKWNCLVILKILSG